MRFISRCSFFTFSTQCIWFYCTSMYDCYFQEPVCDGIEVVYTEWPAAYVDLEGQLFYWQRVI